MFIQNIMRCSSNSCISQISLHNMARYLLAHNWKTWHIAVQYVTVPWHAEILASSTALGCKRLQLCCWNGWTRGGACKLTAKMKKRCTVPEKKKKILAPLLLSGIYLPVSLASIHWSAVENHQPFLETISEWFARQSRLHCRIFLPWKKKGHFIFLVHNQYPAYKAPGR